MCDTNSQPGNSSADVPNPDIESVGNTERLMTRLIDGQASASELRAFEHQAHNDPALWRELALRQLDAAALCAAVGGELDRLAVTPLPIGAVRAVGVIRWAAWSGWAAVVIIAVLWMAQSTGSLSLTHETRPAEGTTAPGTLSPWDHLREYTSAPFVQGELDPILLETRERDDGSIELRCLRRIEEVHLVPSTDHLPRDAQGRLRLDRLEEFENAARTTGSVTHP